MRLYPFWTLPLLGLLLACGESGNSSSNEPESGEPVLIQGESYSTVVVDGQTWLARNIEAETSGSVCYDNLPGNCDTYGRLYNYPAALALCPAGWHLPSVAEWEALFDASGHLKDGSLKATTGWKTNPGPDTYGFGALPAGDAFVDQDTVAFASLGERALFWTSSASTYDMMQGTYSVRGIYDTGIGDSTTEATGGYDEDTTSYHSVRCVKD